ncbi:6-phosphofructo-2-kinase/fructose-2,6-bisphosphatase-like isoform X3 [Tripterygium wilfordii]|uniref:6-phosphofructo-2-kinase/fructose-2, 6-bisphosphatase-like isoform X3 n=1 Tax=Tripterygium wilfordii TaxID=458696 RepID=UPI0018F8519C|nr:6-phosphofructo-2-kinase/fructose-2,6-bisphosphatase-like isoform X3 [Tripterygium wilfordii]
MGTGASKNMEDGTNDSEEREEGHSGGQLYVSLKMENYRLKGELLPHVYGSVPLIGSWDSSKALSMERESASMWELSFVVPPNHETLDFKFLLKSKYSNTPCVVEEGPNRLLTGGTLEGDARLAVFRLNADEVVEYRVFIKADRVSPFDLAASWRAYQENLQPSTVRGIPDVSINSMPQMGAEEMEVIVPDTSSVCSGSGMVESKSVGTFSPLQKQDHRGLFVDRGVGSPRLVKSASASTFSSDLKLDTETKNTMPAAAGAVAAAAVADQMLGPKEHRHLAIVLVGLPARGKTFTAAKLTRYLRWLGHDTKHFNVGKYRRLKHGTNQSADFFRADNPEGLDARNEVAALAMEDMISWMQEGGQVGIFDATNSTRQRRNMLMKMAEGNCKIIFLETICNDERIIERNIRLKIQQSPDYAEEPDFVAGMQDFRDRLANYERVYEPVEEGSYIKMIDMVSGYGGQIQVNNISGYLPGRIVFFLVNTHLTPRPILLTRHGESRDNVRARIGGDSVLSDAGEIYAKKLAHFVEKRLKSERAASIWTSTLQRTILTASPIVAFPKIQWRALDEINAGVCDGMTYEEIKRNMPEEYESRKKDKLRYRYPRGESYLDVIQRLEPVIIELERQRAPVVVISHQAVLRALYAYFADRPLKEIPHIEVPLHTIIEIQMGVTGVQEKRYKLMD